MKPMSNKKVSQWADRALSWELDKHGTEYLLIQFARELARTRAAIRKHTQHDGFRTVEDKELYKATLPEGDR